MLSFKFRIFILWWTLNVVDEENVLWMCTWLCVYVWSWKGKPSLHFFLWRVEKSKILKSSSWMKDRWVKNGIADGYFKGWNVEDFKIFLNFHKYLLISGQNLVESLKSNHMQSFWRNPAQTRRSVIFNFKLRVGAQTWVTLKTVNFLKTLVKYILIC